MSEREREGEKDMVNPVTAIGRILKREGVRLADDFDTQLAKFEAECKVLVDADEERYRFDNGETSSGMLHDVLIDLMLVSGLPIELWFRDGEIHLLSTEERIGRGWISIDYEDNL